MLVFLTANDARDINRSKNDKRNRIDTSARENWNIRKRRQKQDSKTGGNTRGVNNSRDDSNITDTNNSRDHNNSWEPKNADGSLNITNSRVKAEATGASRAAPSAGMLATAEMFAAVETPTIADRKQHSLKLN